MNKKKYVIYQCISKRRDGTIIERIFKFPSFWDYEKIAIALVTTCDAPGIIKKIKIENDCVEYEISQYEKMYLSALSFDELDNPNITITIIYEDGYSLLFNCLKIGEENVEKNITRLTPLLVSAQGYLRLCKEDFFKESPNSIPTAFEGLEELYLGWAKNDIKRLFTLNLEDYFWL